MVLGLDSVPVSNPIATRGWLAQGSELRLMHGSLFRLPMSTVRAGPSCVGPKVSGAQSEDIEAAINHKRKALADRTSNVREACIYVQVSCECVECLGPGGAQTDVRLVLQARAVIQVGQGSRW